MYYTGLDDRTKAISRFVKDAAGRVHQMLTEPNDLVVDPFGGSLTTGAVAEKLERRWLAGEAVEEYL